MEADNAFAPRSDTTLREISDLFGIVFGPFTGWRDQRGGAEVNGATSVAACGGEVVAASGCVWQPGRRLLAVDMAAI